MSQLLSLLSWVLLLILLPTPRQTVRMQGQQPITIEILELESGQAIQGSLIVRANTDVEGFQSARLFFGYANDPTRTWFPLLQSDQPSSNGALIEWDTTTLTDGNYNLRLIVDRQEGDPLIATVSDLRVRNYTPIETNTPSPTDTPRPDVSPTQPATLTRMPPTGTPLPPNPAELSPRVIGQSLLRGSLAAIALVTLLGIYLGIRTSLRR